MGKSNKVMIHITSTKQTNKQTNNIYYAIGYKLYKIMHIGIMCSHLTVSTMPLNLTSSLSWKKKRILCLELLLVHLVPKRTVRIVSANCGLVAQRKGKSMFPYKLRVVKV